LAVAVVKTRAMRVAVVVERSCTHTVTSEMVQAMRFGNLTGSMFNPQFILEG